MQRCCQNVPRQVKQAIQDSGNLIMASGITLITDFHVRQLNANLSTSATWIKSDSSVISIHVKQSIQIPVYLN